MLYADTVGCVRMTIDNKNDKNKIVSKDVVVGSCYL